MQKRQRDSTLIFFMLLSVYEVTCLVNLMGTKHDRTLFAIAFCLVLAHALVVTHFVIRVIKNGGFTSKDNVRMGYILIVVMQLQLIEPFWGNEIMIMNRHFVFYVIMLLFNGKLVAGRLLSKKKWFVINTAILLFILVIWYYLFTIVIRYTGLPKITPM